MDNPIVLKCPKAFYYLQPVQLNDLIRVGNESDGGYLLPNTYLTRIDRLLSLGLGENWTFETELSLLNKNLKIEVYDHTVSIKYFLIKSINGIAKFILRKGSFRDLISRFNRLVSYLSFWILNRENQHTKIRISKESFASIISNLNQDNKVGIKIDIEGSEWEILDLLASNQISFEFIILEVHNFDDHADELQHFHSQIEKNFTLIHLHANNFDGVGTNHFPRVFEIVLVRNDGSLKLSGKRDVLPLNGIDRPNARNRPDFRIEF
jgi:hypothetical protein